MKTRQWWMGVGVWCLVAVAAFAENDTTYLYEADAIVVQQIVGNNGTNNRFIVRAGAVVTNAVVDMRIGYSFGGSNNFGVVTDPGSALWVTGHPSKSRSQ